MVNIRGHEVINTFLDLKLKLKIIEDSKIALPARQEPGGSMRSNIDIILVIKPNQKIMTIKPDPGEINRLCTVYLVFIFLANLIYVHMLKRHFIYYEIMKY